MNVGLLFGSYNPVHNGHIAIAEYLTSQCGLDEVWLVVSPQNPWKVKIKMPSSDERLKMVNMAIKGKNKLKATNFEEQLSKPSYTYESLLFLKNEHPEKEFFLIIGGDNLENFMLWRNWDKILHNFAVWAYPRSNKLPEKSNPGIKIIRAPLLEISSSEIRKRIKQNLETEHFLNSDVLHYIYTKQFYNT